MGNKLSQKSIKDFLSHVDGSDVNMSLAFLKLIQERSANGAHAIKDLFELTESIDSDKSKVVEEYIDKKNAAILYLKYSRYVLSYLRLLIDSQPSVDSFYEQLWSFINDNSFLQTDESKAMALSLIWNEYQIPYFVFEHSGKMEDSEFIDICKRIALDISKARFVVYSNYELKTERAADLINIMNGLNDEKEKQVLLALALSFNEEKARSAIKKKTETK